MRAPSALLLALSLVASAATGCSTETRFVGVEPASGAFTGGEEVSLVGQNFPRMGVTVRFGFKEASRVVMESTSRIKVFTPAGDKNSATDVTLTFEDGRAFQLKNGFRYVDNTQQRQTMDKFFDKVQK